MRPAEPATTPPQAPSFHPYRIDHKAGVDMEPTNEGRMDGSVGRTSLSAAAAVMTAGPYGWLIVISTGSAALPIPT